MSLQLSQYYSFHLSFSQNLVQNGSFENGNCPTFASQLDFVDFWNNPTLGTPEFYHECASPASYVQPPNILIGCYQHPRTGDGYIGLFTFRTNISNFREYAQNELLSPLEQGKCYYFEMYVSHAECNAVTSDGIGVAFSANAVSNNITTVLPITAAVEQPAGDILSDTMNWIRVSGNYTAAGGEKYLIIGNFRDDNATTSSSINVPNSDPNTSYVFIDDVSLTEISSTIDLGPDTLLCSGQSLELNPTGQADTYLWSDGSSDSTLIVNETGTYSVDTWLNGCIFSDEIEVDFIPSPSIEWPSDTLICDNAPFTLEARNRLRHLSVAGWLNK